MAQQSLHHSEEDWKKSISYKLRSMGVFSFSADIKLPGDIAQYCSQKHLLPSGSFNSAVQ